MRRTVMLAAVIAAVGLLLAGLPVAETTPPAQAQTVQHQTEWYINDQPRLYDRGNIVRLDSLRPNWNRNVYWGLIKHGGWENGNSYYTYASLGDTLGNRAEWQMGSRIGTQEIAVHIPGNCSVLSTARVTYEIHIGDQPVQTANVWQTAARDGDCYSDGLVILRNPSGGTGWVVNGAEVVIRVDDNDARPHHRVDYAGSRIGISAAAMRCIDNCTSRTAPPTTTPPPPPPTTTPAQAQSYPDAKFRVSEPKIWVWGSSIGVAIPDRGEIRKEFRYKLSPESPYPDQIRMPTSVQGGNLKLEWEHAGISERSRGIGRLFVTSTHRLEPGDYRIKTVLEYGYPQTYGYREAVRYFTIKVEDPKYDIVRRREGISWVHRIAARRGFKTIDGTEVKPHAWEGTWGGKVSNTVEDGRRLEGSLRHVGRSWIAQGVTVSDPRVVVRDDAFVRDRAILDRQAVITNSAIVSDDAKVGKDNVAGVTWVGGSARVYDNAWVYGKARVYGDAHVYDDARVYGDARVAGNVYDDAHVYGEARVYRGANVYDDARVYGEARVYRDANVYDDARVYGEARVYRDARVAGNARVYGEARVYGWVGGRGGARVCGNAIVYGVVTGNAHVSSGTVPRGTVRDRTFGERCPD